MIRPRHLLQRALLTLLLITAVLAFSHSRLPAQITEVDLELVLAADISDSMDEQEQQLQRAGYAAAFRDPGIIEAIGHGAFGRIAVTFIEWADLAQPRVVVPWRLIDGPASAHAFADTLNQSGIGRLRRTSISGALSFGGHLIDTSPFQGLRRVIDISGDGPNNQGGSVEVARDEIVARGIVINGLPILIKFNNPRDPFQSSFDKRMLDIYYEDCVIGGPGAFMVPIRSREELVSGIRNKLYLEIAGPDAAVTPVAFRTEPRLPC